MWKKYIIMTHQINQKQIKFTLFIALFIGFINLSNSQTLKTISFEEYDYDAIGYVSNNQFVENRNLTFLSQNDTIISGRCFYTEDGNSYIDGIWKEHEDKRIIKFKGIFKVTNNKSGIGISTKNKIGGELVIKTIPSTNYNLEIKYKELKLETSINDLVEQEINYSILKDYILESKKVNLKFTNGDLFNGTVKLPQAYNNYSTQFVPDNGEYKYSTGEVCKGEIFYSTVYYRFLLYKGTILFQDGSIDDDTWLDKYSLTNNEIEAMYRHNKSLTEIRNKAIIIGAERGKEAREKKVLQQQLVEKIRQNKKVLKNKLVAKYGETIGNKIFQGKLEAGMSKSMVSDVWKEEYFTVSTIVRDSQNFEVWEFNSGKMAADLIKEYGEDDAYKIFFGLSLATEFGEINIPRKLIFKNNKLTDVYR